MRLASALLLLAVLGFAPPARATSMFMAIGLGGVRGISADGAVAVGSSGSEAGLWTHSGGVVGLGDLPGGSFFSVARGVSADGTVIVGVGTGTNAPGGRGNEAFRWTSAGGMIGLGDLPGGTFGSSASDVSADGTVVVGSGTGASGIEAFLWTSGGGMIGLGDLPGGTFSSFAQGVSADGTVVVGSGSTESGGKAFRWTSEGGMVSLGDLGGGIPFAHSGAEAVSADGSTVVGRSGTPTGLEAFRWTSDGGMVGLGHLPGGSVIDSTARAVSRDGSIVVGSSGGSGSSLAFLWTAADGMRSLEDVLADDYGLDLTGWTLIDAFDVSPDGRAIVGTGLDPSGSFTPWLAVLPEPEMGFLLALGLGVLAWRSRPTR